MRRINDDLDMSVCGFIPVFSCSNGVPFLCTSSCAWSLGSFGPEIWNRRGKREACAGQTALNPPHVLLGVLTSVDSKSK